MFLHYGPGGNAALERVRLTHLSNSIDFWDQPLLAPDACTFKNLVAACVERYESGSYTQIIGHSFGCDLAQHVAARTTRPIESLKLLSPVQDLPKGFANFAERMNKTEVSLKLRNAIAKRTTLRSTPEELEAFWMSVQALITDPGFFKAYWASDEKFAEHMKVMPTLPQLDPVRWQAGLNDFFLNREPSPALSKQIVGTVYLGSQDPYYASVQEEKSHWESRGFKTQVLTECGHYPHIEETALSN